MRSPLQRSKSGRTADRISGSRSSKTPRVQAASISRVESIKEPSRSDYTRPEALSSLAQNAICRHEDDLSPRIAGESNERVVAARCTRRMDNPDAVDITLFHAGPCSTLQNDDNGFVEPPFSYRGTNAL